LPLYAVRAAAAADHPVPNVPLRPKGLKAGDRIVDIQGFKASRSELWKMHEPIVPSGRTWRRGGPGVLSRSVALAGETLTPEEAGKLYAFEWKK
jgi:hypothetical protein